MHSTKTLDTLKKELEKLSKNIFDFLEEADEAEIKIGEDAITTYLLMMLKLSPNISFFRVEDHRGGKEKTSGCDFELFFEVKEGEYEHYAVQAKKIRLGKTKDSGRFFGLNHANKTNKDLQIELLEMHAQEYDAKPLYMLYNSKNKVFKGIDANHWHCMCPSQGSFESSKLGCTFTPLSNVENALKVSKSVPFNTLHICKQTLPLKCLVCKDSPLLNKPKPKKLPEFLKKFSRKKRIQSLLLEDIKNHIKKIRIDGIDDEYYLLPKYYVVISSLQD